MTNTPGPKMGRKPFDLGGWIALIALLMGLLNFFQQWRDREQHRLDREAVHQVEVQHLMSEVWDILGGEAGTTTITEYVTEPRQLELARRMLDEAQIRFPESRLVVLRWGNYYDATGDHTKALSKFDEAIRLDPKYDDAHNNRGVALLNLDRYEEALAAYDEAIRLDPEYVQAHNNRGVALLNLDRYKEALAAYDEAIRLDPEDFDYHSNRGLVLDLLGRRVEAAEARATAERLRGG